MNLSEKKRLVELWELLTIEVKTHLGESFTAYYTARYLLEQKFPFLKSKEDRESVK